MVHHPAGRASWVSILALNSQPGRRQRRGPGGGGAQCHRRPPRPAEPPAHRHHPRRSARAAELIPRSSTGVPGINALLSKACLSQDATLLVSYVLGLDCTCVLKHCSWSVPVANDTMNRSRTNVHKAHLPQTCPMLAEQEPTALFMEANLLPQIGMRSLLQVAARGQYYIACFERTCLLVFFRGGLASRGQSVTACVSMCHEFGVWEPHARPTRRHACQCLFYFQRFQCALPFKSTVQNMAEYMHVAHIRNTIHGHYICYRILSTRSWPPSLTSLAAHVSLLGAAWGSTNSMHVRGWCPSPQMQ